MSADLNLEYPTLLTTRTGRSSSNGQSVGHKLKVPGSTPGPLQKRPVFALGAR